MSHKHRRSLPAWTIIACRGEDSNATVKLVAAVRLNAVRALGPRESRADLDSWGFENERGAVWVLDGVHWFMDLAECGRQDFQRGWGLGQKRLVAHLKPDATDVIGGLMVSPMHRPAGQAVACQHLERLVAGRISQVWTVPEELIGHLLGYRLVTPWKLVEDAGFSHQLVSAPFGPECDGELPVAMGDPGGEEGDSEDEDQGPSRTLPVRVVMLAIELSSMIKKRGDLQKVIVTSIMLALPPQDAAAVRDQILSNQIRIPEGRYLQRAKVKLDMMAMLYERQLVKDNRSRCVFRYLQADASPQGNFNYFCVREERLQMSVGTGANPMTTARLETHSLPVAVLGWGQSGAEQKFAKLVHSAILENGVSGMSSWRESTRGFLSDQGVERMLADMPNLLCENTEQLRAKLRQLQTGGLTFGDRHTVADYFWPSALGVHGHAHMIFGALEEAVTSLAQWPVLDKSIRLLTRFLKERGLRERFVAICMVNATPQERAVLANWEGKRFDWRWENLAKTLAQVCRVLPVVSRFFSVRLLSESTDLGTFFKDLDDAMKFTHDVAAGGDRAPVLAVSLEILLAVSKAVGAGVGWLELCPCHQDALLAERNRDRRRQKMQELGFASGACPWQARRGIEMALGDWEALVKKVQGATTERLLNMMSGLSDYWRGYFVMLRQRLVSRVCSAMSSKLVMWTTPPFLLLGALGEYIGRPRSACAKAVADCIEFVDSAPAPSNLHRVTVKFLQPGTEFRSVLEQFAQGRMRLADCPELLLELFGYAFVSLIEVRLEGEHSKIGSAMKVAQTGRVLPAAMSAHLRLSHVDGLRQQQPFMTYLEQHWLAKFGQHTPKSLLAHCCTPRELLTMSRPQVLAKIYQYDIASQFKCVETERKLNLEWQKEVQLVDGRFLPGLVWGKNRSIVRV